MDNKAKVAFAVLLVNSFLKEPYEKALVNWTPPEWMLSIGTLAIFVILVLILIPNRKSK